MITNSGHYEFCDLQETIDYYMSEGWPVEEAENLANANNKCNCEQITDTKFRRQCEERE
jgi:hypothetical protein